MEKIYITCMALGIGIPLLSLVLGSVFDLFDGLFDGISNFLDGLEIDFDLSLDIGDAHICFIPVSLQSICAGLLLFGTVGLIVYNGNNLIIANVAAVPAGYVAAAVVQTLIHRLKKIDHSPVSKDDLLLCDTVVTNTIIAGGYGAVSIRTDDGTNLSYPAKSYEPTEEIRQNTVVNIIKFDGNTAIVKKARLTGTKLEF